MKISVGVLFGGASVEHEISILSAMQAMDHLDEDRYEILPIYVSKERIFYQSEGCRDLKNFQHLEEFLRSQTPVTIFAKDNKILIRSTSRFFQKDRKVDVILPIMHGTYGEDGSIQGYLRMLGIPFCGSDLIGAAVGQDKIIMKQILQMQQIPVVPWFAVSRYEMNKENQIAQCEELVWPVIIKPATLGSSIGIHVVKEASKFLDALQDAFQYDTRVIVEKALVHMREFNCAVLGDEEEAQPSCVEEVLKEDEILSYHDKYEGKGKSKGMVSTSRLIPAPLADEQEKRIKEMALRTFSALRASGVARIDFLMDEAGCIYVNEINTIPGSLSFYLFQPAGIAFSELLDALIDLALKRQRRQANMIFSYSTNILSSFTNGMKLSK